jgi:hypothetical protein
MHAHTRTRIMHTRTHHAHHAHMRALCARQLDTFGSIGESEFVDAVIAPHRRSTRSLKI